MDKKSLYILLLAVIYTLVLFYFNFATIDRLMPETETVPIDKLIHFLAYSVLGFVWAIWWGFSFGLKRILHLYFLLLLYGILIESLQETVNPTRSFDWWDLLANCVGIICGIIIAVYFLKWKVKIN